MNKNAHIEFTKQGWRKFTRLNQKLGSRFIQAFVLRREVAEYIAAHEDSGVHLDTICQMLHYDDGVYLLMMKSQGTWYITDIWMEEETVAGYEPMYIWKQMKRGVSMLLARVLIGWQRLISVKGVRTA